MTRWRVGRGTRCSWRESLFLSNAAHRCALSSSLIRRTAIGLIALLAPGARCLGQPSFPAGVTHVQSPTPAQRGHFASLTGDSSRSLTPFIVGGTVGAVVGGYLGVLTRYTCESPECVRRHSTAPYLGAIGGAAAGVVIVAVLEHLPQRHVPHPIHAGRQAGVRERAIEHIRSGR